MKTNFLLLLLIWRRHSFISSSEENADGEDEEWDSMLALFLWKKRKFVHSRNKKVFYGTLNLLQRRRRQRKIPTSSLLPHQSAWRKLYEGGSDAAMITFTGLDHIAFRQLNKDFQLLFDNFTPHSKDGKMKLVKKTGRKRLITSMDCLALALSWTRTRGGMFVLQIIFGLSGTAVSAHVRFGRRILVEVLGRNEEAQVKIPCVEKINEYKVAVETRHPALKNVWMTMDGLKLHLQQSPNCLIQSRHYNGWTHDHYVTNILGFCPAGTVVVACMNVPGCIHDSMVCEWGDIYTQLEKVHEETGGTCTVDSAFSKRKCNFLIKSSQTLPECAEDIVVNAEATAMRQSAEWGMRSFQASFPRIKDRIVYEETGERKLILQMLVLLFNYRANKVGISQIRNTYLTPLERLGNYVAN